MAIIVVLKFIVLSMLQILRECVDLAVIWRRRRLQVAQHASAEALRVLLVRVQLVRRWAAVLEGALVILAWVKEVQADDLDLVLVRPEMLLYSRKLLLLIAVRRSRDLPQLGLQLERAAVGVVLLFGQLLLIIMIPLRFQLWWFSALVTRHYQSINVTHNFISRTKIAFDWIFKFTCLGGANRTLRMTIICRFHSSNALCTFVWALLILADLY